ncbi:MAG: alpha/beta hydrolase-fold protein [Mariniblastus sp.]|nr:alpha/beta hydrolase-fold protein [Mariniblastus sp.]
MLKPISWLTCLMTLIAVVCPATADSQQTDPNEKPGKNLVGTWQVDVDWGKGDGVSKNILIVRPDSKGTIREAGSDEVSKLRNVQNDGQKVSFEYYFDGNREYNLTFRGMVKAGKLQGTFSLLGYDATVVGKRLSAAEAKALQSTFSKEKDWSNKEKEWDKEKDWSDKEKDWDKEKNWNGKKEKDWDKEKWDDKKDWDKEKSDGKGAGKDPESTRRPKRKTIFDHYQARSFEGANGETIQYRLFVPPNYDAQQKYPLVLFHHGGGGTGADNRANLEGACVREWYLPDSQKDYPCIIVAPQIPSKTKKDKDQPDKAADNMNQRIKAIHSILDSLEQEYSIDKDREYVTGLSFGGECTWLSLIERPDRFAAAVPICAGDWLMKISDEERGKQFANFPLWIFHGDDDQVISVDVSRQIVAALRQAGGQPKYTEYPGVNHYSWDKAYRDPALKAWLFRQTRKGNQE